MAPVNLTQIQRNDLTEKIALDEARKSMEKLADSSRHIKATEEALSGLSATIKATNSAASLLGLKSDNLTHVQAKLKTAVEMTSAAQQVADTVTKNSYFNLVIVDNAKKALAATNTYLARTLNISTVAAKALTGTLTLGISVGITAAIAAWDKYIDNQEKAAEKAREQAETERQANAIKLQTRVELDRLTDSLKDFDGTKEQEKAKIDELNDKYGETFGQYDTLAQWYQVLSQKGEAYIQMLYLQAKAQSLVSKAVDADAKVNEIELTPEDNFDTKWIGNNGKEKKEEALKAAKAKRDAYKEQAEAAYNESVKLSKESGIDDFSPKKSNTGSSENSNASAEAKQKQEEERQKRQAEWRQKIADDDLKVRKEIQDKLLAAMKEGDETEETLAREAFDKEMDRIEQQRQERQAKLEEAQKDGVNITPEQVSNVDNEAVQQSNIAAANYQKALDDMEKRRQQEELQAKNNYLKEYGSYEQKRLAITTDYQQRIADAKTQGEKDTLQKKENEAVDALDKGMLQKPDLWTRLFEEAGTHTSGYIQQTIDQARLLLEYLEDVDGKKNIQLPDSIKDYAKSLKPEDAKGIIAAMTKQSAALNKQNPFMGLINGFKALKDAGSDTEKQFAATQNILESFKGASAIVSEVGGAISKMGGSAGETMQKVSGVANSTLSMASTGASIGGPWGAAIGGALGLASGLVGAFGADYSGYNAMVQKYDVLMDVWDQLLDKKKAYIKESYGAEATQAGSEALQLLNSEKEVTKQLAKSRLSSGSSGGSHSLWYRMWKGSYKWEGQNWRDVAGDISQSLGGVKFTQMEDMLNMSSKQLEWIKTNYSGLWSAMDGDFRGYLDNIIQYGDTEKEIIASVKEQLTGVSLDSFQDSYLSLLDNMDSSSEDFANNFEKYLRKSILQSVLATKYSSQIKSLYDNWAKYGEDGTLTEEEVRKLREEQQKISDAMLAERDRLAETFSWESENNTGGSSQSGHTGAVTTVTEETAGKLEGIGLSIQTHVISMDEKMADLSRYSYEAIGLLGSIAENTGYCRCLKDIAEIVNRLERDGMKIKG